MLYSTCRCIECVICIDVLLIQLFFQAGDDLRQQQREGEELQRQMEEDTDQEILALKNRYERQLREQHDENLKLRGDTGILRKKVMNG